MPELPEVENLRRGLQRRVAGQKVIKVEVRRSKLVSGKGNARVASQEKQKAFERGLEGRRLLAVERRAKNLIFRFEGGPVLLAHLKMSGQFAYEEKGRELIIGGHPIEASEKEALPNKHTHVIFEMERGTLFYNDTRMFGYLLYYPDEAAFEKEDHFGVLGLEPLDRRFTTAYFREKLRSKNGALKSVLMNQEVVTGLGNIYADEAAFEAGIRPMRRASSLTAAEIGRLHAAIKRIIRRAIVLGGSSVATYRLLDLKRGNYAREHKVYGKSGTRCSNCASPLRKTIVQGRTTVYCPKCQR